MKFEKLLNKLHIILGVLFFLIINGMDYVRLQDPFRDGKLRWTLLAASLAAFEYIRRLNLFVALFVFYASLQFVMLNYKIASAIYLLMVIAGVAVAGLAARYFRKEGVYTLLLFSGLFQGVYGLFQFAKIELFWTKVQQEFVGVMVGTMGHNTVLAPLFAICAMASHNVFSRLFFTLLVFLCDSTMGVISLCAGFLYLIWRENRRVAVGIGFVCASVFVSGRLFFDTVFFGDSGRLYIWKRCLELWQERPFIGWGPGNWAYLKPDLYRNTDGLKWDKVHNDFLQALFEHGLIGFAIILVGLGFIFYKAENVDRKLGAMLLVLCTNALGNFPFHIATYSVIGLWLIFTIDKEQKDGRIETRSRKHSRHSKPTNFGIK